VLARRSGFILDTEALDQSFAKTPDYAGTLIGLARHASGAGKLDRAIELCRQAVASTDPPGAAYVALGEYLLADARSDELEEWKATLPSEAFDVAETWRVLGHMAESRGEQQQALQAFLEAAQRGPELKDVTYRLMQLLQQADDQEAVAIFQKRLLHTQKLEAIGERVFSQRSNDAETLMDLIVQFEQLGRVWEAIGWSRLARKQFPNDAQLMNLNARLEQTIPGQLKLVSDERNESFLAGLALNAQGTGEGCMGIAIGDIDEDQQADLLLTNVYGETNTFYRAIDEEHFIDDTTRVALEKDSRLVLGFGTQFVDINLDGRFELIVANGHVDDLRDLGRPYEMPAQIFDLHDGKFRLCRSEDSGEYFTNDHLGRSLVVLDWNVDGRPDAAIGHLVEPYALLTNTTDETGNSAFIRLIGTQSPRDPVGAVLEYMIGDKQLIRHLTAGDGYHASNQHEIILGCGANKTISKLRVRWPSGDVRVIENLTVPGRYTICENGGSFRRP
jgi:tetratricopeptide (TPR) repeat protein